MEREHSCMGPVVVGSRDGTGHRMDHGVVAGSHRLGHEHVVGSVHSGGHRSNHGVVGCDHGIRVENSCAVVGHGGRSHPLGMEHGVLENGNGHGRVEYLAGSSRLVSSWSWRVSWIKLTSATQVTRAPLNSLPSSLSTAVLKSAALSNSTKLRIVSSGPRTWKFGYCLPLAIAVAASLRVDDIKAGLTSKVLQVLDPDPCELQVQGSR